LIVLPTSAIAPQVPLSNARHLSVFLDEWDIDVGENVVNRIDAGLKAARYVIVIMSSDFFKSGWTNLERTDVVAEDPVSDGYEHVMILPICISKKGYHSFESLPARSMPRAPREYRLLRTFKEQVTQELDIGSLGLS
jgi:hypothetical protein